MTRQNHTEWLLKNNNIPERFDPLADHRDLWRGYGMWGIVDLVWTKALANFVGGRKCLEIMAGRGWLSKALRHHGVDVIATGKLSNSYDQLLARGTVTEVEELDAVAAVAKYGRDVDVLVVSWPVADLTMYRALQYWGYDKPIIFVGEWYSDQILTLSGCASDEFFFAVRRDDSIAFPYPNGNQGIDTAVVCYRRKEDPLVFKPY